MSTTIYRENDTIESPMLFKMAKSQITPLNILVLSPESPRQMNMSPRENNKSPRLKLSSPTNSKRVFDKKKEIQVQLLNLARRNANK